MPLPVLSYWSLFLALADLADHPHLPASSFLMHSRSRLSQFRKEIPTQEFLMKPRLAVCFSLLLLVALGSAQDARRNALSPKSVARITREVRHELLMLPYFGVFDNITYKVEGSTVTLMGQVVRPSLKSDAQNAVKHIEGVEKIDNQIEILPPSSADDRIRFELFRAIYQFPALQKYEMGVQKPIRIIVKNGHVTLEGVVDNRADKDIVGIRAKSVSGTFSVTNNLQVVPS
jgi:osmotically-inducible protein OsmY